MTVRRTHPPTRAMRETPDIDQLRRQARELLEAYRAQAPDAVLEVNSYHRTATPDCASPIFPPTCESITQTWTAASERSRSGRPATVTTPLHTQAKARNGRPRSRDERAKGSSRSRSQRPDVGMNEEPCVYAVRPAAIADAAADPGPCVFARLYGRERDLWRNASQDRELDATPSNRQRPIAWLGTTHRVTTALGGRRRQRRPRRRHRPAPSTTSPAA
jgi:hypothetical protein